MVYRPENIEEIDQNHRHIADKNCAISALSDGLKAIKTYLHHAALKQGMTKDTQITALADGAQNCWSALLSLKPHCRELRCILDWFHIGKKYQTVKNALGDIWEDELDSSKWTLWHGDAQQAMLKLAEIKKQVKHTTWKVKRENMSIVSSSS